MIVTRENVEQVAELAKLNLTEDEKDKMAVEMEKMLLFVGKLDELDTSNTKPMEQVVEIKNVFREDKAIKFLDRDQILGSAPTVENGCFKVPRVVE